MNPIDPPVSTWKLSSSTDHYDARWAQMAASGENPHGEADLILQFAPVSVLDGGCGTGRVAIELARRGVDVVGVDVDEQMLAAAGVKAPTLRWIRSDLATVDLGRTFDVVALPGNVMIFVTPGHEGAVVANMSRHLSPGARLIAGFQLRPVRDRRESGGRASNEAQRKSSTPVERSGRFDLLAYDQMCTEAGLTLEHRWATWSCQPFDGGDYAVSVHVLGRAVTPGEGRTTR